MHPTANRFLAKIDQIVYEDQTLPLDTFSVGNVFILLTGPTLPPHASSSFPIKINSIVFGRGCNKRSTISHFL